MAIELLVSRGSLGRLLFANVVLAVTVRILCKKQQLPMAIYFLGRLSVSYDTCKSYLN